MLIGNRMLVLSLITGVIVLCGCAVVYFLSPLTFGSSAAPPDIEPGDTEPTAPVQTTELPATSVVTAQPERRRLTLEFPPQIRAGDSDLVRLTLEVDDLGNLTSSV